MRIFLNGQEMQFAEGGYQYIFLKPYKHSQQETIPRESGKLHIQLYDNGVQIRTLITNNEVSTLVNRNLAIDTKNQKIYILEEGSEYQKNPDGSVEILSP
ncbi:MAG: hypothetical protein PHG94_09815 [Syntrophomonas sp.]|uniref:hypothetical protein n=1 Tax=Syntrophomonas sp. TaxID=2053627 RepID=UPI00261070FA|nr:hypothetical protein [Syntrophomonas sp.]MDD2511405.1 hypothetical protein [Syntrophomonas sp.]MDD4627709.1 hypothetical protein [Syntrophomonas sp.]